MFNKQKLATGTVRVGKRVITVPDLSSYYIIEAPEDVSIESMVEEYKKDPNIEYVSPDYIRTIYATPNDPLFKQYQQQGDNQWALYKIGAPNAWDITTGSNNVTIAVLDTGVNYNHEDLAGKVILGRNYLTSEGYPGDYNPMDDNGHGTHVAGIIGANTNNRKGIAGVDWNCKILAIKTFNSSGSGNDWDIIAGIQYAADNGANIINMSFGGSDYSTAEQDAINYAYASGCILVAAAGNDNTSQPRYPAAYNHVIAVGATDTSDNRAGYKGGPDAHYVGYSNYGPWVDICAPGGSFYVSSDNWELYGRKILSCGLANNSYVWKWGTSMSAPFVSGVAALIKSLKPNATPDEVEGILEGTADYIGEGMGAGRVNAQSACELLSETPPPTSELPAISDFEYDKFGNEYVVYCQLGKVVKYDPNGIQLASFSGLSGPYGIACSPDGARVYVSDTYHNRVLVLSDSLKVISHISGPEVYAKFIRERDNYHDLMNPPPNSDDWETRTYEGERFNLPKGITTDNNGYVYVSDSLNNRILKYDYDGNASKFDIVIGKENYQLGNSWFVGHEVYKTFYSNKISGTFDDEFSMPSSVSVKGNGIYVSDSLNNRVQQFDYSGSFSGSLSDVGFNFPVSTYAYSVTADAATLYIADKGNHRIQRYTKDLKYTCTYGNHRLSPSPLKVLVRNEKGVNKLYFCDAKKNKIQSCCTDLPPSDFHVTIPTAETYYINNKGLDISWGSTHESDFIQLQQYQIVGKRSDRDHWEVLIDNVSPETRSIHLSLPSEGLWAINVRAFNGTAYRDSDGYGQIGSIAPFTYDDTSEARNEARQIHAVCDFTPPTIYDFFMNNNYFSPVASGTLDATFRVTDAGSIELQSVNVNIFDNQYNYITALLNLREPECGKYNISWDGKDYYGKRVSDGHYLLYVNATDKAGNYRETSKEVIVDTIKPKISNISLSTNLITPNDDGINDSTQISFALSKAAAVSLEFKDLSDQLVRKIDIIASQDAVNNVVWDGKSDEGEVTNGTYKLVFTAVDLAGNETVYDYDGNIQVDKSAYLLDVMASPEVMSLVIPNPNPITLYYSVPDTCTVEAYVTYMGGNIYSLVSSEGIGRGTYKAEWNGKDNSGNNVKEGSYNYIFSAVTPKTNFTKKGIVRIDNSKPYASKIAISPSEESIQELDQMTDDIVFSYYLTEKSFVTIDILDSYGAVVSNIVSSQPQEAKGNSVTFSKDKLMSGGVFEPGVYPIRLKMVDEAGNEETISKAQFTIISGLSISNAVASPLIFTPNGDNHDDYVTFKYKVSGGIGDVTAKVKIKSLAGATVKTFTSQLASSGFDQEIWDGKDEQNNMSPDGQYQYEISASDSIGNQASVITGSLTLIRNPTIIVYADPKTISSSGSDMNIYYNINYQGQLITGNSQVTENIYDRSNTIVYYFSDTKGEGNYSNKWNGQNNQTGGIVPNGTYRLEVKSSDPTGTIYYYATDLVVGAPLQITGESPVPAIFTPNGDNHDDNTTIGYVVSGGFGSVVSTVEIKTLSGTTVKTFTDSDAGTPVTCSFTWDGKNGSNNLCPDGKYQYEITAADSTGDLSSSVEGSVILAANPTITMSANPKTISPNNDGVDDTATIHCAISYEGLFSGNSQLTIEVFNGSGIKVYSLTDTRGEGSYSYPWGGENNQAGGYVPDGTYTLEVQATDPTGTVYSYTADLVVSAGLQITGESAVPIIFSPNGDGHDDTTIISYFVSGGVGNGVSTVEIKSLAGTTVKVFSSPYSPGSNPSFTWNGKDVSSNPCPDGEYTYKITAVDSAGNSSPTVSGGIVLAANAAISMYAAPKTLFPNGDGITNASTMYCVISYGGLISGDSQVAMDIFDHYGIKVYSLADTKGEGSYSYTWGGENNQAGGFVPDGTYTLKMQASDPTGTVYSYTTDLLVSAELKITGESSAPIIFTPNGDGHDDTTTIGYVVSGGVGNIVSTVEIKTLSGTTVRTFTGFGIKSPITGSFVWDGKDISNSMCPDGKYICEISALDSAGNTSSLTGGDITLVKSPTISLEAAPLKISPNGDGVDEYTVISYSIDYKGGLISGNSQIAINIYDKTGTKVYSFTDTKGEGNYSLNWDGLNNQIGGKVMDGTYTLEVQATDPTGTVYPFVADLIIDRGPPKISDNGISPTEPITPNGDSQQDDVTIKYQVTDVGNPISSVEVRIYNSAVTFDASTLVRSLIGSAGGDTLWDGRVNIRGGNGDADGNGYADMGLYKYVIKASDVFGNTATLVSNNSIQVDKVYLSFGEILSDPSNPYFSPNGDGIKDSTVISFNLETTGEVHPYYLQSKGMKIAGMKIMASGYNVGKVTMKIKDMSGNTIRTLMDSVSREAGITYEVTWDGKNSSGTVVSDGSYTIEVKAVDMIGDPATNSIISGITSNCSQAVVDTVAPVAQITSPPDSSWQKGTINIIGSVYDANHVNYSIGYNGSYTNLGTGEGNKTNESIIPWDASAVNKTCTIELYAVDAAGNTAEARRTFNVDNLPPQISNILIKSNGQPRSYFNPYLDGTISVEYQIDDNSFNASGYTVPCSSITLDSDVWNGATKIAALKINQPVTSGSKYVSWTGLNDASPSDYVNEGNYQIRLSLTDLAGNNTVITQTVSIADDQQVTTHESGSYSHDPNLQETAGYLFLKYATGESFGDKIISRYASYYDYGAAGLNFEFPFTVTSGHQTLNLCYWMALNSYGGYLMKISDMNNSDSSPWRYVDNTSNGDTVTKTQYKSITLPAGKYYAYVYANAPHNQSAGSGLKITYEAQEYNRKKSLLLPINNGWNAGITLESIPDILSASSSNGKIAHYVWSSEYKGQSNYAEDHDPPPPYYYSVLSTFTSFGNNQIVYNKRTNGTLRGTTYLWGPQNYWSDWYPIESRISNGNGDAINPAITTNTAGTNVYVVWEDYRNNGNTRGKIYLTLSTNSGETWPTDGSLIVSSSGNCIMPSIALIGNTIYVAYIDDANGGHKELYVRKGTVNGAGNSIDWSSPGNGTARITMHDFTNCEASKPSIVCETSGNAYVAWEDTRTGTSEIFFQKIPSNFAPFTSSGMTTMSMPIEQPVIQTPIIIQSSSSTPELISPIDKATVKSLRPTFKWYGVQNVKDYRIECATTSDETSLSGSLDYFTATITDVSAAKPVCEYTQNEHFMGLDESTPNNPYWYWRVQTITSEASTSEVGSFRIELPSSLSSVTNWPNPFDPNKERTKIRYRLGREPNSVTIRIYDITGALVKELDGTTNPEGASIWSKYNDVEWDGRNGRGDLVLNGIYPFEITVNYGDKSVTGRGNIAVLK